MRLGALLLLLLILGCGGAPATRKSPQPEPQPQPPIEGTEEIKAAPSDQPAGEEIEQPKKKAGP